MSRSKSKGFWHEFRRLIIKADFKSTDSVLETAFVGGVSHNSIRNYLSSGKVSRFFDRLWRVWLILLFGFVAIIVVGAVAYSDEEVSFWLYIAGAALGLYSVWMVLISQAWLRWMHRHRNDPQRKP